MGIVNILRTGFPENGSAGNISRSTPANDANDAGGLLCYIIWYYNLNKYYYIRILAEKRDKKGEKSLPGPPRIALSVLNSFIKGLETKGLYQSYDKYYRKPLPNGLERCIEVSDALCGCGCGRPAAASEHYCGCCEHRMMAFCCQTLEEDEGHGSKGLCFHCWKKHSHEADGML